MVPSGNNNVRYHFCWLSIFWRFHGSHGDSLHGGETPRFIWRFQWHKSAATRLVMWDEMAPQRGLEQLVEDDGCQKSLCWWRMMEEYTSRIVYFWSFLLFFWGIQQRPSLGLGFSCPVYTPWRTQHDSVSDLLDHFGPVMVDGKACWIKPPNSYYITIYGSFKIQK